MHGQCNYYCFGVDDIIIAATDSDLMSEVKESLSKRFKMEDLGELKWSLGTEFRRNENEMQMNQTRYIQKILSKFKMSDCKPKPSVYQAGGSRYLTLMTN